MAYVPDPEIRVYDAIKLSMSTNQHVAVAMLEYLQPRQFQGMLQLTGAKVRGVWRAESRGRAPGRKVGGLGHLVPLKLKAFEHMGVVIDFPSI